MLRLEDLPDEITLKILNFVNIKDLFRCLAVNKKLRTIANDQSLWSTMHLEGVMPAQLLPQILAKGCQHLSLYHHRFTNNDSPKFAKNFQLKYLAVENDFQIGSDTILPELATSCYGLEKLYVYVYPKDFAKASKMMKCIIQNSQSLKILYIQDLDQCQLTMSFESVKLIITLCVELTELSITYTNLSQESIDFICENLTPKIEKFDISWNDSFDDKQLKKLLNRCNKLTELDFSGTQVSNKSVSIIVETLSPTLTKLETSYGLINLSDLLKLAAMPKIQVLGYDLLSEEDQKKFEEIMPHLCDEAIEKAGIDDYVNIAMPYQKYQSSSPAEKVWEIEAKLRTYDGVGIWDDLFAKNPKRKKTT